MILSLLLLRSTLIRPFEFYPFLLIFVLCCIPYLIAVYAIHKKRLIIRLPFLILSAIVFRIILLTNEPILSNDVYRYQWDGTAILHGVNPLQYSPNDPEVSFLQKHVDLPPDHQNIPSVYPPLAQAYFAGISNFSSTPWGFSLFAILLDVFTTLFLGLALHRRNQSASLALIFAWHPLAILESAHSGHLESLGLLFVSLALFIHSTSLIRRSAAIAFCALIKLWPISLLLLISPKKYFHQHIWTGLLIFLVPSFIVWTHADSLQGLFTFIQHWEFHASIYAMLQSTPISDAARIVCIAGFFISMIMIYFWQKKNEISFELAGLFAIASFLLFSPTVHPWYALWLLPFLVFNLNWVWIYFSLSIILAYQILPEYLESGVWQESSYPRFLNYSPVFLYLGLKFILYSKHFFRSRALTPPDYS